MHFYRPQFFHTIELYFLAHSFPNKTPHSIHGNIWYYCVLIPAAWCLNAGARSASVLTCTWVLGRRAAPPSGSTCCGSQPRMLLNIWGGQQASSSLLLFLQLCITQRCAKHSPDVSYNFYAIADMCVCLGFTFMTTFFPFERNCDVYALW